jgi:hypothetical protein
LRTILDEARMWQVHAIVYQDDLQLILAEMFVGEADDTRVDPNPVVQKILRASRPIEVRDDSRLIVVRFSQAVAWQVVNESFTSWDEYEERDDKSVIQIITRSKYLDYVHQNHGWFRETIGPAKLYRVLTANEVIDVVACEFPTIEPWKSGTEPVPSNCAT